MGEFAESARKKRKQESPAPRADEPLKWLTIRGARQNNLLNVDAAFPLARFTCVTGVSGSGKSSLVNEILYKALARELNDATSLTPGLHDAVEGLEHLDKVIAIDQTPIGRTPRSNPATYIKVFDEIRDWFTRLPDAKLRGYKPGRFSFNVNSRKGGGRCEACEGNGANRIEMDFLADIWATCPVCEGRRFTRETLQIRYKGKSIADVLESDVQQALELFENSPRIRGMLQTLHDVGLDYIKIGQPAPTLSGGEAQRIKLARELVKRPTGRTLYVLDEPTTGLHFEDIRKLLTVLHSFVDAGNTVVVIEHNLDVLKTADWLIDLGPDGGERGGRIIAQGTPEQVAAIAESHTGQALRDVLNPRPAAASTAAGRKLPPPPSSTNGYISVSGARQHNLKDLTVRVPRDQMTVCTGVSGSGKTSFAIDTVFTEGYRRYVESLSAYARQFLGQMAKPRVDHVEGLSPAICIEQKAASRSPRSTVGTITEVYDYMRVLWSRVGAPHCPNCQIPVGAQTVDEIVQRILSLPPGSPIMILAPVALGPGESYGALFTRLKGAGYTRVRIDGEIHKTAEATTLDARRRRRVEVVVDRTVVREKDRGRINESVEHALAFGGGVMTLLQEETETVEEPHAAENGDAPPVARHTPAQEYLFSQRLACSRCGRNFEDLSPHHFSFNSPLGWCETCEGLGAQRGAPAAAIVRYPARSLFKGAIAGWPSIERRSPLGRMLLALCAALDVSPDTPLEEWTQQQRNTLLYGDPGDWIDGGAAYPGARFHWRGFIPALDAATRNSWTLRHRLHNVVTDIPCSACRGGKLRPEPAASRLGGRTIVEICETPLAETLNFFKQLKLSPREQRIAGELIHEIVNRLQFLIDVGLHYVTLHRAAPTLSGGEAQRIRLASQIGSGLSGVLYVLDEPTIGLHPRDTRRLIEALAKLRALGNTLLLVEHDRDVIKAADRLLDFGPRAGAFGGEIVAEGPPREFLKAAKRSDDNASRSLTRGFLSGAEAIPVPRNRRPVDLEGFREWLARRPEKPTRRRRLLTTTVPGPDEPVADWLLIRGARQNNLRDIEVPIPLGRLVGVSGVSGSGKSSLVNDILWPALARALTHANLVAGAHDAMLGVEALDKAVNVDQSPLGATPSSNPATYTGVFDWIRELFARLPESKARGFEAKRFSFNRPGGRCEACEGNGQKRIEMHFMPDVWVECEACHGKRYAPETLEIRFKGRTIADVLEMRGGEALKLFENVPKVRRMLQTLADVGLDYLQLGQPAHTLSGGEAQRVKLAAELGKPSMGRTLYLLDEPTTGLHFDDVRKLLNVLHRLVDLGNTVIVVEHNLDVLKSADWIIDLGPEGGAEGGRVVAMGTPEEICTAPESRTGVELAPALKAGPFERLTRYDPARHAEEALAAERARFGDIGKQTRMPWQIDGRKWHLEQRANRDGKATRWDPQALAYVIELTEKIGGFPPANWNNRASVEITAEGAPTWFLHALTGGEWLLELYFRVPPRSFSAATLDRELGLKPLDEREDIPSYGSWRRVDVRQRQDGLDAVAIYVHDKAEIDTPAFRRFVKRAVARYHGWLKRGR